MTFSPDEPWAPTLDELRRIYGVKTDREVIARALKIALDAAKAARGGHGEFPSEEKHDGDR